MIQSLNLANQISRHLPAELVEFMHLAGSLASRQNQRLFLVGGVVRDLLLGRNNLDLDLVAEGDALKLAEELADLKNGKVIAHSRFNTAKIKWGKWSVDIATARAEAYENPGALPSVECNCDIQKDLIRRDFTINAMAIYLDPLHYGQLIDLYQGQEDLQRGYIRILHDNSFKDDATRIWRAVRYEQRLDFEIESHTLEILRRDLAYLDTISGDRIRHELELCLEEECPEKSLVRAGELGILQRINPHLTAGEWLAKKISKARGLMQPYCPPEELYLAFLVYRFSSNDLADLMQYLRFPRSVIRGLQDTLQLKNELVNLSRTDLLPSQVYRYLHPHSQTAIMANLLATDSVLVRRYIELYLNKLRHIQLDLSGDDLLEMSAISGPRMKEILEALHEAKLDGRITTREDELQMAQKMGRETV